MHGRVRAAALVAALAGVLTPVLVALPDEHASLPTIARIALATALSQWHTLEPVNEVVYGSRGFDTFGETFLLLAAVTGISLVARSREARGEFVGEARAAARENPSPARSRPVRGVAARTRRAEAVEAGDTSGPATPDDERLGTPAPEVALAMSLVVRVGVRVACPVLAVAGCYLVAWGYSPGGGFPAGAVLFGVVLLAYVSLGYRRVAPVVRPSIIEALELGGALGIVALGIAGLVGDGAFFSSVLGLGQPGTIPSGGLLQSFSGLEFVEVATGLTIATFGLLGMRHDWAEDGDGGETR